jgi:hypothetical protein
VKTFRNLTVECGSASKGPEIKSLVDAMMPLLDHGWRRDTKREQELKSDHSLQLYCFACSRKNRRKAARLFLGSSDGQIRVTNIVPDEVNQLSHDEYNLIICEFSQLFVKPAAETLGYRIVLTEDEERIDDFLTPRTGELLRAYSAGSHKGQSSLPAERVTWLQFLIAAHRENAKLDGYRLKRWLTEEERWWEDSASEAADEYEFGRALLAQYDRHG